MKIQDQPRWLAQQAEIVESCPSPEIGEEFIAFITEWCETAEWALDDGTHLPIRALRAALGPTELRRGNISANWLAQMLLVICGNWSHGGDELFESMTEFEKRMVGDMGALWVAKMQESAQEASDATV